MDKNHPEAVCNRCGCPNIVWHVENTLWNRVHKNYSILCPICFVQLAESIGVIPPSWLLIPKFNNISEKTVFSVGYTSTVVKMRTENDHDPIREHILTSTGVYQHETSHRVAKLSILRKAQWNTEFFDLCSNRMVLGAMRYGCMSDQKRTGNNRQNVESIIERAELFLSTGNLEHLCDIANLAMVEFTIGQHPKRHWAATDDAVHAKLIES